MKIVFLGGRPLGAKCLKELIRRRKSPELVVPDPQDTGKNKLWYESVRKISRKYKLKVVKPGLTTDDRQVIKKIERVKPDIIFSIFYTKILRKDLLSIPRLGCVNIHFAPLPRYRGYYPGTFAIINGEKKHGVTMHFMNEKIDIGDAILQKNVKIEDSDTGETFYKKCVETGLRLFKKALDGLIAHGTLPRKPQDRKKSLFYKKSDLMKKNPFDLKKKNRELYDLIRALTFPPFPPPSFYIGDEKMVIIKDSEYKRLLKKERREP